MGWSCRREVSDTMSKMDQTFRTLNPWGLSNGWMVKGLCVTYELSNIEHNDGAATGQIYKEIPGTRKPDNSYSCKQVGSFRIEPNGKISRGPKVMRKAAGQ